MQKEVREPKQKRSAETREKICKAALKLFCEVGYYKTTTNAVAKAAGVPIGSLYSYFADKDALFLAILSDYNALFTQASEGIMAQNELYRTDRKAWLRALIERLIAVHEQTKDLNREIKILSLSRPDIKALCSSDVTKRRVLEYFTKNKDELAVPDTEAAAVLSYGFISSVIDYLVFENPEADRRLYVDTAVEGLYRALGNSGEADSEWL